MNGSVSLAPKGTHFTQLAIAIARGGGDLVRARDEARLHYGESAPAARVLKAAVDAGSMVPDATWGDELATYRHIQAEIVELVNAATIVGRLAGIRRVPLNVKTPAVTAGAVAGWVAAGRPKPVTALAFDTVTLPPLKCAALCVLTDELVRFGGAQGMAVIQRDLVRAVAQAVDAQFIDPTQTGTADESPASIAASAPTQQSTGDPGTDAVALMEDFAGDVDAAYLVMHPLTAVRIAAARDTGGGYLYPDLGPRGGSLLGVPVLTSRAVPTDSSGGLVALIDPTGIALGDDGVRIDSSGQAALQMTDGPDTGANQLVSLWQNNLTCLRLERMVNWQVARVGSVAIVENCLYAGG